MKEFYRIVASEPFAGRKAAFCSHTSASGSCAPEYVICSKGSAGGSEPTKSCILQRHLALVPRTETLPQIYNPDCPQISILAFRLFPCGKRRYNRAPFASEKALVCTKFVVVKQLYSSNENFAGRKAAFCSHTSASGSCARHRYQKFRGDHIQRKAAFCKS
jgi:hypothetical protein